MNIQNLRVSLACLLPMLLLPVPAGAKGQFEYEPTNGTLTVVGYTGAGGAVVIPSEDWEDPFAQAANQPKMPVTSIGGGAFSGRLLTSVTIPATVTNIGAWAFFLCPSLTSVYFEGNAPTCGLSVFGGDGLLEGGELVTAYYLPGTTGWNGFYIPSVGGDPATTTVFPWFALWLPQVVTGNNSTGPGPGVQTNQFGFVINWAPGMAVAVDASTSLVNPTWVPLATNTLPTSGTAYFIDPQWTNYPTRFYRLRLPQRAGSECVFFGSPAGLHPFLPLSRHAACTPDMISDGTSGGIGTDWYRCTNNTASPTVTQLTNRFSIHHACADGPIAVWDIANAAGSLPQCLIRRYPKIRLANTRVRTHNRN